MPKAGSIFIGKDDDGTICGLPNAKKRLEDIPSKAKQQLGLTIDVNLHEAAGKQFLEIPVHPSSVAISLRSRYYYRTGSTKIELTDIALNEFLLNEEQIDRLFAEFKIQLTSALAQAQQAYSTAADVIDTVKFEQAEKWKAELLQVMPHRSRQRSKYISGH